MLSYEFIQFLNQKVLEFLPSGYVRVGDKLNMRCPLCGDSKKSATKKRGWWYNKSGSYYCFNCSTGMSGINFLKAISGSSYEEIRKEYTRLFLKSGLSTNLSSTWQKPDDEPSLFEMKSVIKPEWKNPLSEKATEYLNNRKVLDAPFLQEPLYSTYAKKSQNEYILIPWTVNGVEAYYQLNDFQKLTSMKYIFPKDMKKLIYGLDNIDISFPYIFLFEGVFDSLFVLNGVATGTKAVTSYQLKLLKERYPYHQLVISFDNDASGIESMQKLIQGNNEYKFFKWFDANIKAKDINELVQKKSNVNIFSDPNTLKSLVADKLMMKMHLMQCGKWIKKAKNGTNSRSTETREVRKCSLRSLFPIAS